MKLATIECPAAALPVFAVLPPETPVSAVLRAARDLISVPERWTKWGYSFIEKPRKKAEALTQYPYDVKPEATCYCSLGAVMAITRPGTSLRIASMAALERLGGIGISVPRFNDHPLTTHADVLRMFNRAIRHAEAREALALTH